MIGLLLNGVETSELEEKENTMRLYASNGTASRSARRSAGLNRPFHTVALEGRSTRSSGDTPTRAIRAALAAVIQMMRAW